MISIKAFTALHPLCFLSFYRRISKCKLSMFPFSNLKKIDKANQNCQSEFRTFSAVSKWTASALARPYAFSDARKFSGSETRLRAEAALWPAKVEPERIELCL